MREAINEYSIFKESQKKPRRRLLASEATKIDAQINSTSNDTDADDWDEGEPEDEMENDRPGETGTDSKVVPDFDENDPETEVTTDIPAETGINSTVIPDFVPGFIPEKNSTTVTVIAKDNSTTPTPAPAVETESCYNTLKGLSNNFLSQGEIVLQIIRNSGKDYNDFGRFGDCTEN